MTKEPALHRYLSRRSFITGAAVFAATLALPALPEKAYAWDSYSVLWDDLVADPFHEDMTQFAYVKLWPDFKEIASGKPGHDLLVSNTQEQYEEIKEYLRQGAFWNDVAANTIFEFGANYLNANSDIPAYGKGYKTAMDIARHLKQTQDNINHWMIYLTAWGRALVRFSMNRRGNVLHSMLGVESDGKKYLSHETQRDFIMEWLEAAYKYVIDDSLTEDQTSVVHIFDTYSQLGKGVEDNATSEQQSAEVLPVDGDAGIYDEADRVMTKKQIKLRALGMMCHTIQDSFNPAHTIRSYYSESTSDNVKFGDILAFGNYEEQCIHAHYDHIACDNDRKIRAKYLDTYATLDGISKNPLASDYTDAFYTLGLKLASDATYKLLSFVANDTPWGTVQRWLEQEVFHTYFTPEGESYVYDGGRRAGSIPSLSVNAHLARILLEKKIAKAGETYESIAAEFKKLEAYQKTLDSFYHQSNGNKLQYHLSNEKEEKGSAAAKTIIDLYDKLFFTLATDAERATIKQWGVEGRRALYIAIQGAGGIVQECALDVTGSLETGYLEKTKKLSELITSSNKCHLEGSVQYATEKDFALRLSNGTGTVICTYAETALTGKTPELLNGQRVALELEVDLDNPHHSDLGLASSIEVASASQVFDAKGVVKAIADNSLVITVEGSGDVALAATPAQMPGDLSIGQRISFDYTVGVHEFILTSFEVLSDAPLLSQAGTILSYTDTGMIVQTGNGEKYGEPITQSFSFGMADFVGDLAVGSSVEVLYYDYTEDQAALQALYDADVMKQRVPYEASRIAIASGGNPQYVFASLGDATHLKVSDSLSNISQEACVNENGTCPYCGYVFTTPKPVEPSGGKPLTKTGDNLGIWGTMVAAAAAIATGAGAVAATRDRQDSNKSAE